MDVGRRKLVGKRNGLNVAFEALGAFVVQDLQDWFESAIGKVLVEFCEGSGEIAFYAIFNVFHEGCIRIVVVETMTYLVPRLEVCRKRPVWSLKNRPEMDIVLANTLYVWTLAPGGMDDVVMTCCGGTVAEVGKGLVERTFWRSWRRWPLEVAIALGRCLRTREELRPIQVVK